MTPSELVAAARTWQQPSPTVLLDDLSDMVDDLQALVHILARHCPERAWQQMTPRLRALGDTITTGDQQ